MKLKNYILKAVLFVSALLIVCALCGCNESKLMDVDTALTIDNNFSGEHTISLTLPESIAKSGSAHTKFDELISQFCPKELTLSKLDGERPVYTFKLQFASKAEYCEKLKAILSYEPIVAFGVYDNILTKGWCIYEDFNVTDMLAWLEKAVSDASDSALDYKQNYNRKPVITVNGITGENKGSYDNIYASKMTGYPIHSVEIQTTNYKNKTYDRKIILSFPESTYDKLSDELESYISELAGATSTESWTKSGNYYLFEAFYQNIDCTAMGNYTSKLLFCPDESAVYGDLNNASTALAQQLVFEEKTNLLGFISENKSGETELTYSYTLPSTASAGEGITLSKGIWSKQGLWNDGKYTLNSNSPILTLRIPDGAQYKVNGINIQLEHNKSDEFTKKLDFVFPKSEVEGFNYTSNYFKSAGAEVVQSEPEGKKLTCSVIFKGSSSNINDSIGKIFGGGNYITLESRSSLLSVSEKSDFKDNISIDYMLGEKNAKVPITYTFVRNPDEYVSSILSGNTSIDVNKESYETTFKLDSGDASVLCKTSMPFADGITFCVIVFSMLTVLAIVSLLINFSGKRRAAVKKEAPSQASDQE